AAAQTTTVFDVLAATESLTVIGTTTLQGGALFPNGSTTTFSNLAVTNFCEYGGIRAASGTFKSNFQQTISNPEDVIWGSTQPVTIYLEFITSGTAGSNFLAAWFNNDKTNARYGWAVHTQGTGGIGPAGYNSGTNNPDYFFSPAGFQTAQIWSGRKVRVWLKSCLADTTSTSISCTMEAIYPVQGTDTVTSSGFVSYRGASAWTRFDFC